MSIRLEVRWKCAMGLLFFLFMEGHTLADWSVEGEGNIFYTDDVAIFSASQRLSLREDPTQPVIDVTDQGQDIVLEPLVSMNWSSLSQLGRTEISGRAQGFVFTDNTIFNHGTYGFQVTQELRPIGLFGFRYHYGPNLFLGVNEERRTGNELLVEERITTHFWVVELEREVTEGINLRLLGRYGLRFYNEAFAQRDTQFWTISPHLEWEVHPRVELMMGFHYERGLADGRREPQFHDDISYINYYGAVELNIRVFEKTFIILGFDYERNNFTSGLVDDIHRDGFENIFQGDFKILHVFTETSTLVFGYQRGQRKFSFEPTTAFVNNVWIGGEFRF